MRAACAAAGFLSVLAACSGSSSGSRGGFAIAPATSATPTPVSSATPAPTSSTNATAPLASSYPTPAELARRHAPLYRFNAWIATSFSICNKTEDYFPMSARSFFDQLAASRARLVTKEAARGAVGENAEVALTSAARVEADFVHDTPSGFAGDEPGQAPVYFHAYEDRTKRVRRGDGSGSDLWYVEYWLFYGQDASRERVFALGLVFDVGGHKGDWEATTFAVRVTLGPGGAFLSSEVVKGYFSGHGEKQEVELADMTLADDQGRADPRGAHPVGFIAVGKHATYPEAGYWTDNFNLLPLAIHDEYFLGNGVAWSSWLSPLVDLEDGNNAAEFAPPSFAKLAAPSLNGLLDWRAYKGRWGDSKAFSIPLIGFTLPFGNSPTGPWAKGSYGGGGKYTRRWSDVKRTSPGLTLRTYPVVVPAPLPIRK